MSTTQARAGTARSQAARRYFLVRLFATFIGVLVLMLVVILAGQFQGLQRLLEASDLRRVVASTARWFALGVLLAFPVLYFVGGRSLASRFADAEDRAARDTLTGLNNDAAFREALGHEVARTERFHHPFTLVVVNVDDFAEVNEEFGHERADDLLRELAGALRTGRSVDLPFRVGGDEFAVIMPHTDLDGASWAVKRIRQEARARMGETSVSVGLAVFDPGQLDGADTADTAAVLRDHADLALREAKRRGRNGVVSYAEIEQAMQGRASAASITAVRRLVRERRMTVEFQPVWDLGTHEVLAFAARSTPGVEYGLDAQEAFEAASWLGLTGELDALSREAVLVAARDLPEEALILLPIEAHQIARSQAERIRGELAAAGLEPERMVLGLLGGQLEPVDALVGAAARARALGFRLAVVELGPGGSALELVRALTPDVVQVGAGVLLAPAAPAATESTLTAILRAAYLAGATVVVEQVDTPDQLSALAEAASSADLGPGAIGVQGDLLGGYRPSTQWTSADPQPWPDGMPTR